MKCYKEFMAQPGPDNKSLKEYLHRIEEAEKRDHRLIAKKMDLFHLTAGRAGDDFLAPEWLDFESNYTRISPTKLAN